MPRVNPLSDEQLAECRRLRAFREVLGVPAARLEQRFGMTVYALRERENERVPWQPGELPSFVENVRAHLIASLAAFEKCFGEPVFLAKPAPGHPERAAAVDLPFLVAEERRHQKEAVIEHLVGAAQSLATLE